jgi:hypothetical protein
MSDMRTITAAFPGTTLSNKSVLISHSSRAARAKKYTGREAVAVLGLSYRVSFRLSFWYRTGEQPGGLIGDWRLS